MLICPGLALLTEPFGSQSTESPSTASAAKAVGTIKAIDENAVTLSTDEGSSINIVIQDSPRIVRTAPGEKDLKSAEAVQLRDLQPGDRILVKGAAVDSGKTVIASSIIVMSAADVAARQHQEREDWQKRGVDGLVTAVNASAGTIIISKSTIGGSKTTTVRVFKNTVLRRYVPNSINFDDATPGTVNQIKVGDQLWARGTRSADGSELAAEEIVSGIFRNIGSRRD